MTASEKTGTLRSAANAFPELVEGLVALEPAVAGRLDSPPPEIRSAQWDDVLQISDGQLYPLLVAWLSAAAAILFSAFTLPRLGQLRVGLDEVLPSSWPTTVWAVLSTVCAAMLTWMWARGPVGSTYGRRALAVRGVAFASAAFTVAGIYATYSAWVSLP